MGSAELRPLGIPAVRDRTVEAALKQVLEPIFEADLQPEQYAYRQERSALDAVQHVYTLLKSRHWQVIDADLSGYFDSIPHAELMKSVSRRVSDGRVLRLIKMWLVAPVEEIVATRVLPTYEAMVAACPAPAPETMRTIAAL